MAIRTVLTQEPGGTPLGEEVKRIVLHMRGMSDDLEPRADALLYAAGRAQHTGRVIRPALDRGEWVVCSRYIDSSMAYQGAGYGNDLDEMRRLQSFATGGLRPDLTILLDVPVEVGLERTRRRKEWNRFEDTEEVAFFERVRAAYLALADEEPERFRIVDGAGSVADSDEAIRNRRGRCLRRRAGGIGRTSLESTLRASRRGIRDGWPSVAPLRHTGRVPLRVPAV